MLDQNNFGNKIPFICQLVKARESGGFALWTCLGFFSGYKDKENLFCESFWWNITSEGMLKGSKLLFINNFIAWNRDIHIECSKQFKWNLYLYKSGQSWPFWAVLKLLKNIYPKYSKNYNFGMKQKQDVIPFLAILSVKIGTQ